MIKNVSVKLFSFINVMASLEYLDGFGFEVIEFGPSARLGGDTFLIKAVPTVLSTKRSAPLIKDMAEELGALRGSSRLRRRLKRF